MSLENQYRHLLWTYPRAYRERRGEEMLGTLLDGAAPGQIRPSRRDSLDILSGALRERLGMHAIAGLDAGLRVGGSIAIALAAGFAASDWLVGTRTVLSTAVGAAWLVAVLLRVCVPDLRATPAVAAWLTTVVAATITAARPTLVDVGGGHFAIAGGPGRYGIELLFGLVAVLAAVVSNPRQSTLERVQVPGLVAGLMVVAALADGVGNHPAPGSSYLLYPSWTKFVWLFPVGFFAIAATMGLRSRNTGWLWAGLLLLVPVPLTLTGGLGFERYWTVRIPAALPGTSEAVLLAAALAVATYLAAHYRSACAPRDGSAALAATGALCLGAAGGLGAVLLAVDASNGSVARGDLVVLGLPVVISLLLSRSRPVFRQTAILLAIAALVGVVYMGRTTAVQEQLVGAMVALLVIACATGRLRPASSIGITVATAGVVVAATAIEPPWASHFDLVQTVVAPCLVLAVLVPTLGWAVVAVVRGAAADRTVVGSAIVTMAAALAGALLVLPGPAYQPPIVAAIVVIAVTFILAVRVVVLRNVTANPSAP